MGLFGGCVLDTAGKPRCWGPYSSSTQYDDEGFEKIGVSRYNICGFGSDGVECSLSRYLYDSDELQARIGTVVEFVMSDFNNCAITLSGPVCWDHSFPSRSLVFENVFSHPSKAEFSKINSNKGCGLENDQLICFGNLEEIDLPL